MAGPGQLAGVPSEQKQSDFMNRLLQIGLVPSETEKLSAHAATTQQMVSKPYHGKTAAAAGPFQKAK